MIRNAFFILRYSIQKQELFHGRHIDAVYKREKKKKHTLKDKPISNPDFETSLSIADLTLGTKLVVICHYIHQMAVSNNSQHSAASAKMPGNN